MTSCPDQINKKPRSYFLISSNFILGSQRHWRFVEFFLVLGWVAKFSGYFELQPHIFRSIDFWSNLIGFCWVFCSSGFRLRRDISVRLGQVDPIIGFLSDYASS